MALSDLEWSCEVFVIAELLGTIENANWASIRANQIFFEALDEPEGTPSHVEPMVCNCPPGHGPGKGWVHC
jgi:hypothetical protein